LHSLAFFLCFQHQKSNRIVAAMHQHGVLGPKGGLKARGLSVQTPLIPRLWVRGRPVRGTMCSEFLREPVPD
jgi:hypothetical protein